MAIYDNEFEQRKIKFKPRINLNHNIIFHTLEQSHFCLEFYQYNLKNQVFSRESLHILLKNAI